MKNIITAVVSGLVICGFALSAQITDNITLNMNIPSYCQFEGGLKDISFVINYNPASGEWEYSSSPTTNTFQLICITGTEINISGQSKNNGYLVHKSDSNYQIQYQLQVTVYDNGFNSVGSTNDIFNSSITGIQITSEDLYIGINDVNITTVGSNAKAGIYSDTVTLQIEY